MSDTAFQLNARRERPIIPDGFLLIAFTFLLAFGLMTAGFAFSLLAG